LTRGCPNMEKLCLEECKMTEVGLNYLATYANLKCLKLGYSKGLNDAVLTNLARGCPHITELDLSYCNSLTSDTLLPVLSQFRHLLSLNLRGYQHTLHHLHHPTVENLNLSWCKSVDDSTLATIAQACPNLMGLDLAWLPNITGNAIHNLAGACMSLRSLNLRGCTSVSMVTVQYLCGASIVIYR